MDMQIINEVKEVLQDAYDFCDVLEEVEIWPLRGILPAKTLFKHDLISFCHYLASCDNSVSIDERGFISILFGAEGMTSSLLSTSNGCELPKIFLQYDEVTRRTNEKGVVIPQGASFWDVVVMCFDCVGKLMIISGGNSAKEEKAFLDYMAKINTFLQSK